MVSPWMSKGALVNNDGGPPEDSIPVLVCIAVLYHLLHYLILGSDIRDRRRIAVSPFPKNCPR
jgi:hypothetical protein